MGIEDITEFLDMSMVGVGIALASTWLAPVVYPPINALDDYLIWRRYEEKKPTLSNLGELYVFHLKHIFGKAEDKENPLFREK